MAEDIIESFHTGHQAIVDLLDRTQVAARSYLTAKPSIRALGETLVAHFGRQTNQLFEELRLFYQNDRQATKMIEFLVCDLKDSKIAYLIFFEKHSGELSDLGSKAFPRELGDFAKNILGRIKVEEEYLLPLIQKMKVLPKND